MCLIQGPINAEPLRLFRSEMLRIRPLNFSRSIDDFMGLRLLKNKVPGNCVKHCLCFEVFLSGCRRCFKMAYKITVSTYFKHFKSEKCIGMVFRLFIKFGVD